MYAGWFCCSCAYYYVDRNKKSVNNRTSLIVVLKSQSLEFIEKAAWPWSWAMRTDFFSPSYCLLPPSNDFPQTELQFYHFGIRKTEIQCWEWKIYSLSIDVIGKFTSQPVCSQYDRALGHSCPIYFGQNLAGVTTCFCFPHVCNTARAHLFVGESGQVTYPNSHYHDWICHDPQVMGWWPSAPQRPEIYLYNIREIFPNI